MAAAQAPGGGGEVQLRVPVVRELASLDWTDEGMVKRIRGVAFSAKVSPQSANRMVDAARGVLNRCGGVSARSAPARSRPPPPVRGQTHLTGGASRPPPVRPKVPGGCVHIHGPPRRQNVRVFARVWALSRGAWGEPSSLFPAFCALADSNAACRGRLFDGPFPSTSRHQAETTNGFALSADGSMDPAAVSAAGGPVTPEDIGARIASLLVDEIATGGAVDSAHQARAREDRRPAASPLLSRPHSSLLTPRRGCRWPLQVLALALAALGPERVSKVRVGKLTAQTVHFLRELKQFTGLVFHLVRRGMIAVFRLSFVGGVWRAWTCFLSPWVRECGPRERRRGERGERWQ